MWRGWFRIGRDKTFGWICFETRSRHIDFNDGDDGVSKVYDDLFFFELAMFDRCEVPARQISKRWKWNPGLSALFGAIVL